MCQQVRFTWFLWCFFIDVCRDLADPSFMMPSAFSRGCPNHHQLGFLCIQVSSLKTSSQTYPKGLGKAKEPWKCFMAQYVLPFIKTPFFVVNSFYDSWQFHDRKGKLCCNIAVRWYVALVIWLSDSACICIYLLKDGLTQLLNGLCW